MGWREDIAAEPTSELYDSLDEARSRYDSDLSQDEYALARMIASEDFSGTPTVLACLGDAELNRKPLLTPVYSHLTGGEGYGSQGGPRPASTARPPAQRHCLTARLLMRSFWFIPPPARGVSRGARSFFSPSAQLSLMNQYGIASYCPPDVILKRWTYSLSWSSRASCSLGTTRGSGQLEWVGPIDGVDPYRQMFMRPRTGNQDFLYGEALKVIESHGAYKGAAPPIVDPVLLAVVVGLAASSYLIGGIS